MTTTTITLDDLLVSVAEHKRRHTPVLTTSSSPRLLSSDSAEPRRIGQGRVIALEVFGTRTREDAEEAR